ncbi:MAG TPA: bifunctional lysine ketoglutarate reductase /saccharopine dehydrogenase family protein [Bacteroidales bacterium]|nr:bifunctional lysine ketoglutarate reductase /saccharopine dehydrogenase family protein [Bacteroidales bacterium]HNS47228.1 bifunctional lysine ketoglutarate reductase /saccharopine dehydrogenase family protein [Bacteroidales bacterium]
MNDILGIRIEDKYKYERRVPLIPLHIHQLMQDYHLEIQVQSSEKRIFKDHEFAHAGAHIVQTMEACPVIMGIKEIPLEAFEHGKTYMIFAHVIKGQPYNMPMLRRMMELNCNLIDYERITDEMGKRLIFFGRYAGLAGMINSLWSFGERLNVAGLKTPFMRIKQARHYDSLDEARWIISEVGQEILEQGLPDELQPLVIGFTGYGNVSAGAQEIASLLPIKEITPEQLLELHNRPNLPKNVLYKVVFKESDLVEPIDPVFNFELQDYYIHGKQKYRNQFERYIPHLSILVNGMYWDDRYPRIVTRDFLEQLYAEKEPKLKVIGDITCDVNGSVECTHKGTEVEDPVFVYDPFERKPTMGFKGKGLLVMAVDILPTELPRESSIMFSEALWKYMNAITRADYSLDFYDIELPAPIKRAMILHKGELTPDYAYISKFLK